MSDLRFHEASAYDVRIVQQMIHDAGLTPSFNLTSKNQNTFVACKRTPPVGFVSGHQGFGKNEHVLFIDALHLTRDFNNEETRHELVHVFLGDMKEKLDVTHFMLPEHDRPCAIDLTDMLSLHFDAANHADTAATPQPEAPSETVSAHELVYA